MNFLDDINEVFAATVGAALEAQDKLSAGQDPRVVQQEMMQRYLDAAPAVARLKED